MLCSSEEFPLSLYLSIHGLHPSDKGSIVLSGNVVLALFVAGHIQSEGHLHDIEPFSTFLCYVAGCFWSLCMNGSLLLSQLLSLYV